MGNTRDKCVLCNGDLKTLKDIKMPIYMGIKEDDVSDIIDDMVFTECINCGEIQMSNLIDLELLYQINHNNGVIGKIWENHYIEFSEFIKYEIVGKNILEISDPSAKVAKLSNGYKSWTIVEPNPENIECNNVKFIKSFFTDSLELNNDFDIIIHSHLLEHMYSPLDFMELCNSKLKIGGYMFISVPDMEYLLNNQYSPNNILHFEHTYYLDSNIMEFISLKSGFEIVGKYNYNNHSIFYKLKKITTKPPSSINIKKLNVKFNSLFDIHLNNIKNIQDEVNKHIGKVYIFGAHVSSQFYLYNGLDIKKIDAVLDNSPYKIGKKLYGTDLLTISPHSIDKNSLVIVSHAGIYYDEIVKQLLKIDNDIKII